LALLEGAYGCDRLGVARALLVPPPPDLRVAVLPADLLEAESLEEPRRPGVPLWGAEGPEGDVRVPPHDEPHRLGADPHPVVVRVDEYLLNDPVHPADVHHDPPDRLVPEQDEVAAEEP